MDKMFHNKIGYLKYYVMNLQIVFYVPRELNILHLVC